MVRFSNDLIGILNFITFLLSIPNLGTRIWLSTRASTDCEKFLERPMIALGAFLMIVSLAGFIGACCGVSWLQCLYVLLVFILILLVFCFTIFAFVVTNKGAGKVVSGRGYKEFRLGDYSNWLQKRVLNDVNWAKIRSCIHDSKVCNSLSEKNQTFDQFVNDSLTPLQSGCCKPPTACNFTFVSETMWNKTPDLNSSIADCSSWQNDPSVLCYDCQSCKAGVLANLKNDLNKVAIVNTAAFDISLVIVYSIGCCAYMNNRRNNYHGWNYGREGTCKRRQ